MILKIIQAVLSIIEKVMTLWREESLRQRVRREVIVEMRAKEEQLKEQARAVRSRPSAGVDAQRERLRRLNDKLRTPNATP